MTWQSIFKRALFYISVPTCVLCGERLDFEDKGLCKSCRVKYDNHKTRDCSRCGKKLHYCTCASNFLVSHSIKRHIKLFRYMKREEAEAGKHLIYSLKRDNREDVLDFLASELDSVIRASFNISDPTKYYITNVPRRRRAIIQYGFDHTACLAVKLSKRLDIEYKNLLISKSKLAQKETKGIVRLTNVNFDYKAHLDVNLSGKTVFVIDDLVTTGASMCASAMLIKGLGARECVAVSIAVAKGENS